MATSPAWWSSSNGRGSGTWYHTLELPGGEVTPEIFDLRPYIAGYGIPERLDGMRALEVGTWEAVRGTLGRRSRAGTFEPRVQVKNGAGAVVDRCHTGRLRWSASAPQSLYYGGSTSEAQPTVLQLANDRQSVKTLRLVWFADCSDGGSVAINDALDDFPVTGGASATLSARPTPTDDGGQVKYDYEIAGNVGARIALGTFHVVLTATDTAGAVTATCESPVVRWNAR